MSRSLERKNRDHPKLEIVSTVDSNRKSISKKSSRRKKLTPRIQSLKKKSKSLSLRKKSIEKGDSKIDLLDSITDNIRLMSTVNFEHQKKSFFDFRRSPLMVKTHYFLFKLIFCGVILPISIKISGDSRDLKEIMVDHMSSLVVKEGVKYSDVITFIIGNTFKRIISPYLVKIPCLQWIIEIISLSRKKISNFEQELEKIIGRKVFTLKTMMIITSYYKIFESIFKKGELSESSYVILIATIIGLLDIIFCSFKSSWCGSFKNIENMTWFIHILIEILGDLSVLIQDGNGNGNDLSNALGKFCKIGIHNIPAENRPEVMNVSVMRGVTKLSSMGNVCNKVIEAINRLRPQIEYTKMNAWINDESRGLQDGTTYERYKQVTDHAIELFGHVDSKLQNRIVPFDGEIGEA